MITLILVALLVSLVAASLREMLQPGGTKRHSG